MCRWLAYSGAPILMKEALYGGTHSLVDQSLHSRLGAETTNGDGFGVGWYGAAKNPGLFHSIEPAWNDQNLRELAGHISSSAVLHPHPRGDRQCCSADQLPPLPPRPVAVHAPGLHQRVRRDQTRPDTRRRPVPVRRDQGPSRHRGAPTVLLSRADVRPGEGRPARPPSEQAIGLVEDVAGRHGVPHPFQGTVATTDGETIWAFRYSSEHKSRTLFFTTNGAHATRATSRNTIAARTLGRCPADRFRTPRQCRRRLERGARRQLGGRRPGPRRDKAVPAEGTDDLRTRRRVRGARSLFAPGRFSSQ